MGLDVLQCDEVRDGERCREWRAHAGPHTWDLQRFTQADLDEKIAEAVQAERDDILDAALDLFGPSDDRGRKFARAKIIGMYEANKRARGMKR